MLCSRAWVVLFTGAGSSVMIRSRKSPVNIGLSVLTAAGNSVDALLSGTGSPWILKRAESLLEFVN